MQGRPAPASARRLPALPLRGGPRSRQQPGVPILVVDLRRERGRGFRAIPSTIQSIENNLSIANMDFFEFANAVDEDGVFRGFRKP